MTKVEAVVELYQLAFKNSLYYTVEALYLTFGRDQVEKFIIDSMKYDNMEMLIRFYQEKTSIPTEKLIIWSVH